jgi:hypothetical protein
VVESDFVEKARLAAEEILEPPLRVKRAANLLYQVTVNNRLEVTVSPRTPMRGQSAFQTDLCVFEEVARGIVKGDQVLKQLPASGSQEDRAGHVRPLRDRGPSAPQDIVCRLDFTL